MLVVFKSGNQDQNYHPFDFMPLASFLSQWQLFDEPRATLNFTWYRTRFRRPHWIGFLDRSHSVKSSLCFFSPERDQGEDGLLCGKQPFLSFILLYLNMTTWQNHSVTMYWVISVIVRWNYTSGNSFSFEHLKFNQTCKNLNIFSLLRRIRQY